MPVRTSATIREVLGCRAVELALRQRDEVGKRIVDQVSSKCERLVERLVALPVLQTRRKSWG